MTMSLLSMTLLSGDLQLQGTSWQKKVGSDQAVEPHIFNSRIWRYSRAWKIMAQTVLSSFFIWIEREKLVEVNLQWDVLDQVDLVFEGVTNNVNSTLSRNNELFWHRAGIGQNHSRSQPSLVNTQTNYNKQLRIIVLVKFVFSEGHHRESSFSAQEIEPAKKNGHCHYLA